MCSCLIYFYFSISIFVRCCVGKLNSFDLPSYKRPTTVLESINNITSLQSLSSDCTIINNRLLSCLSPGFYGVQWTSSIENNTSIHWVPFDDTPYCYIWDTSYVYDNNSFLLTVMISDELADGQIVPSNILTHQFWLQGEQPRLSSDNSNITISSLDFNNNSWQYNISGLTNSIQYSYTLTLQTSISSLLDCTVRPVRVSVARPKYHLELLITEVNPPLLMMATNDSTVQLFKDTSEPSVAIVTQGIINIITQDGYKTHTVFQVNGFTNNIQEIVFTSDSLCILIGGELITLTNENSSVTWPSGLPSEITHISGRGKKHIYGNHDIVIAWSHMMSIYVSIDGGRSFDNITMTTTQDYIIHTLTVHPVQDKVLILVYSDNTSFSIHYDILTQVWRNTSQYYSNSSLLMEYFPSPFGDLLIWERQGLYYSNNGDGLIPLNVLHSTNSTQQEPSPYEWKDNEYIHTVTTGISGQIAVITSEGQLLYGRTSTGHVIEIPYYINPNTSTIFFDTIGNLQFLSICSDSLNISMSTVPVYSLLLSSLYPPIACPFIQWTHNINSLQYYYLDINDTLQLWISLIPRQWSTNNISVLISNDSVFERNIVSVESQTAVEGIIKRNMSIVISPLISGHTVLKITPTINSLSCNQPAEEHVELLSLCPLNKHIQLIRDNTGTTCNDFENYMYTISKNYYDPNMKGRPYISASIDKVVLYNVTAWGCPIIVPFNQNYKPILALYDGNTLIEQVTGDYVLREIHGRTDINYNATANSVGCIRRPQTWEMMLENMGNEPWNAWTPQTYESCFEGSSDNTDSNTQYQIFNTQRPSTAIQWHSHNGIYVFAATVIAKNYSFCNLTVVFGVQVYGASTFLSYLSYILLIVTCLVSSLLLILSYILYRQLLFNNNLLVTTSTSTTCTREK